MSYSEPNVEVVPLIRLAVIAVGCLIAGPYLLVRYYSQPKPPALAELQQVTGPVTLETGTHRTRRSANTYPVLMIAGQRYDYLHWFPGAAELPQRLRSGETISIWTDANANRWVWQIERGGEQIVPYSAVCETVASNRQWEPVTGVTTLLLGAGAAVALAIKTRPFWMTTAPPKRRAGSTKARKKTRKRPRSEWDGE